jgi:hypothetical protein
MMTRDDVAAAAEAALNGRAVGGRAMDGPAMDGRAMDGPGLGGRRLVAVERVAGGSRKGVYGLTMDDSSTAIAYVWAPGENYWPGERHDPADPFAAQSGLAMFTAAHARLVSLGLRVPEIYLVDSQRRYYPADIALVEDFPGGTLQDRFEAGPAEWAPTVARLSEDLARMRRYRAPAFGTVAHIDAGGRSLWASCEQGALDFGLRCLAGAAARDGRIAAARDRLAARLRELAAAVRPRTEFSVVHGELGLDHVMVDRDGRPVLIDIEDLMYADAEWEHVFLRIRLHDDYRHVAADGLDEDRLALYLLVQRLSLTAGPLRLLESDFPDRAFMRSIAEHNLNEALNLLRGEASGGLDLA